MPQRTALARLWSLVSLTPLTAPSRLAAQTTTSIVRCESIHHQRAQCRVPYNARVQLTKQLSAASCREGESWGTDYGLVWVNNGCRADFAITEQPPVQASGFQLRACQSEADRRLADYSFKDIQVTPELRESTLTYIRWTAGPHSGTCVVQPNGWIVQFTTDGRRTTGGFGEAKVSSFTCESARGGRSECRIPPNGRLRVIRPLVQGVCRPNDTYGQGLGYVWVDKGCRVEYEVSSEPETNQPSERRITCESDSGQRAECRIPFKAHVQLVMVISRAPCRQGESWGVTDNAIWVDKGCRAEFAVQPMSVR